MEFNTRLLHGNNNPDEKTGATNVPVYQSTSFRHATAEELERVFAGREYGYIYSRMNNPTVEALEKRIAHLEGGIGAVACASGMSAVALTILNLAAQGDEIVTGPGLFGGTFSFFQSLSSYGIIARFAGNCENNSIQSLITEKTKLIFVETIGNPKLDVPDLTGLADLAHSHNIPLVVDSTVTTPYLCRPFAWGADIVIHSTSKLINGSGNSIGGIIVDRGGFNWSEEKFPRLSELKKKFSAFAFLAGLRTGLHRDLGACMAPFNAYLNCLGLETMGLRLDRICANALELAHFLEGHPAVARVNYPGLSGNPYHERAKTQYGGKYGPLLTFNAGSKERAFKVINSLKYAFNLANIGDIRTLVIHPASTICLNNTAAEKALMGVTEDLIRVSVGIEGINDLVEDFKQALGNN